MPEPQANQPINFNSFADWCLHKDSLSKSARYTVEVLLERAGTSDCNEAEKVLLNLTELDLYENEITDITPLSGLTNLTYLNLGYNQISDITPLSGLTNLTELNLGHNQITDITSLSEITNLTILHLYGNQITDITGLSALTNLTELDISSNQITYITGLSALTNLAELSLSDNEITDITGLSALTNLTTLNLAYTQITDITLLSALTNLTKLRLAHNEITDITGLSALTNLTKLYLYNNEITDITALSALTNLTELDISSNQITDITPLSALTNLTKISLQNNPITDLNLSRELTHNYQTLSTSPIDFQQATETVNNFYVAIGREAPQVIICSSPQAASIKLIKQLNIYSRSQYQKSQIAEENFVWGKSLLPELFQLLKVGLLGMVLWDDLWDKIILEPDGDRIVVSEFQGFLGNYRDSLAHLFSYSKYLKPLTPTNLAKEIHLTEFFISKLGVTLDRKAQELLRCKQQLFEECGWILPFEKICLVCDRPLHLRFDSENRLHAEGESAIAFADGYSLYFHHGVKLPEQYGKVHPDFWQAEWLLSEENAELRRLLIERIGYDRLCCELQAVELDSWQEYTLLKIDNADVEPIYLLKMTCPSTGFIHALRVPPDVESAKEAIRWVNWGIDPEEFSVQT